MDQSSDLKEQKLIHKNTEKHNNNEPEIDIHKNVQVHNGSKINTNKNSLNSVFDNTDKKSTKKTENRSTITTENKSSITTENKSTITIENKTIIKNTNVENDEKRMSLPIKIKSQINKKSKKKVKLLEELNNNEHLSFTKPENNLTDNLSGDIKIVKKNKKNKIANIMKDKETEDLLSQTENNQPTMLNNNTVVLEKGKCFNNSALSTHFLKRNCC